MILLRKTVNPGLPFRHVNLTVFVVGLNLVVAVLRMSRLCPYVSNTWIRQFDFDQKKTASMCTYTMAIFRHQLLMVLYVLSFLQISLVASDTFGESSL